MPAELWFGKRSDVKKLKIFGCVAHLHIPKELNPRKFDSRSMKCIMIGYTNNDLWCPKGHPIICERGVIFDETRFDIQQPFIETIFHKDSNSDLTGRIDETDQYESALENQEPSCSRDKFVDTEKNVSERHNEEKLVPRRSTRERKQPAYLQDYCVLALHAEGYIENVPNYYAEINSRDDREE